VTDLHVPSISPSEAMEGRFQVVDVRSPMEFAEGHMPAAVNLPLLDDLQRAAVGTAYKHEGACSARMTAMELVSPGLAEYLHTLSALARSQPKGRRLAVMCWRGGERSRNVVLLLALIGVHAVTVEDGYRGYRREVLSGLSAWSPPVPVFTLYGHTGAGKSALLRGLAAVAPGLRSPRPWPWDLEKIALHRGSLLGGLNQPGERRQKDFDALLWDELRRVGGDYLVLECEGGKIGRIFLAERMASAVRTGTPIQVTASVAARAERILGEYSPNTWDDQDRARFRRSLGLIAERLPRGTHPSLERAFDDGRFSEVVERLLSEYYDPMYHRSCVEGREFVLEFETSPDPIADAHRFVKLIAPHVREAAN
jgi:tRNA 2-selenouridine synthase